MADPLVGRASPPSPIPNTRGLGGLASMLLCYTDFRGIDLTAFSSISATLIKSMEAQLGIDYRGLCSLGLCVAAVSTDAGGWGWWEIESVSQGDCSEANG